MRNNFWWGSSVELKKLFNGLRADICQKRTDGRNLYRMRSFLLHCREGLT